MSSQLPTIRCPIQHRTHPAAEGGDDRLFAWARRFDLIRGESAARRFYDTGFAQFCAVTYPQADELDLMSEWMAYAWIVDDLLDEGHTTLNHKDRVRVCHESMAQLSLDLHGPSPTAPVFAALADLWTRAAEPMSMAWRTRFVAHYRDWLGSSLLPHATTPPEAEAPTLRTYERRRRIYSGCEFSFDLIEAANHYEVPELVTDCELYTSIRSVANDVISWTNDIYSIRKDAAHDDHLVALLRNDTSDDWDAALTQATRMIEEATLDFLTACADLRTLRTVFELDDEVWRRVEDSLTDLGDWIAGSLYWHTWSPRYSVVEVTAGGQAPSYLEPHLIR